MTGANTAKERERFEAEQRDRITSFRRQGKRLEDWWPFVADECYRSTQFFNNFYGTVIETMRKHPSYSHLKGVDINKGKYYYTGDPVRLVNMATYLLFEFLLPQHQQRLDGSKARVVSDFRSPDMNPEYFHRFFDLCALRHEEADSVYGELNDFLRRNPAFEHLDDGFLRNRQEYQEMPWQQPILDMGNYVVYEARAPIHRSISR